MKIMEDLNNEQLLDFLREAGLEQLRGTNSDRESVAFQIVKRKDLPFAAVRILLEKIEPEIFLYIGTGFSEWTCMHQICCHSWTLEEIQELVETPHFRMFSP